MQVLIVDGEYFYERHYSMVIEKIVFILFFVVFGVVVSTSILATNKQEQSFSEDALVKDAIRNFKKAAKKNKDEGDIQRITCKFKKCNDQLTEIATKTYFNDYHMRPAYESDMRDASARPDSVIEVTYDKKQKNALSLVSTDGRGKKRLYEKHIDLPVTLEI
jgi:hypothetical protein